jgi:hypothetical protein
VYSAHGNLELQRSQLQMLANGQRARATVRRQRRRVLVRMLRASKQSVASLMLGLAPASA